MTSISRKAPPRKLSLPDGVLEIMELFSVPSERKLDDRGWAEPDRVAAYKRLKEFRDSSPTKSFFTEHELIKIDWALDCLWDSMSLSQKITVTPYIDEPDHDPHEDAQT